MRTKRAFSVERHGPRRSGAAAAVRFLSIIFVVGLLGAAGVTMYGRLSARTAYGGLTLGPGAPDLTPLERMTLATYLSYRAEALAGPAGDDPGPVVFTVAPGETAGTVSARLARQGLVRDADLLRYYMRYNGLDTVIEAGTFVLRASMSIPEVAQALGDARAREVIVRVTEGWRLEQIADYLDSRTDIKIGRAEFLALTAAGAQRPGAYSFYGDIPPGNSLEGFLFPDTYILAPDSSAADLVHKMLQNFDERVTNQMRAEAAARGLTLYQIVMLASIVEREAIAPDERPLIASVYLNRLSIGMKLDADPTVQYALGYQADTDEWWKRPLTLDDLQVDSPYNTYRYAALPPGPIANPGLDSIRSTIYAATTDYLFFRAACDGSGRHVFSQSFEEHLANACS